MPIKKPLRRAQRGKMEMSLKTVEFARGGKTYSGSWYVKAGVVYVSSAYGFKNAETAGAAPEGLAETMLRELVG